MAQAIKQHESQSACPYCGSPMWPEYDYTHKVKVLVCTRPTCLYRLYPDYPRRKGNEEVCYLCGKLFIVRDNSIGMLCADCKQSVREQKGKKRHREGHRSIHSH